jgi:hypothetical protein
VDPNVAETLTYLASLPGWFVPASEILERLLPLQPRDYLPRRAIASIERAHVLDRIRGLR